MTTRGLVAVAAVVIAALAIASAALADTAVIPDDGSLPWTDPNHQTPLELVDGKIASAIVGRPVTVWCEGATDWGNLHAPDADGYVNILYWQYNGSAWAPVFENDGLAQLSPDACTYLVKFARAAAKPTKCSVTKTVTETTYKTVRVKRTKRVRIHGRWVVRTTWKTKRVPVTTTRTEQGPPQACYMNGAPVTVMPASFWTDYGNYAHELLTLVHEAWHLAGDVGVEIPDGYPSPGWTGYRDYEARAECHGMQWIAYAAEQLGDTADDAQAVARFYYDRIYPQERGVVFHDQTYWSADCVPNGRLDLTPGDGLWP